VSPPASSGRGSLRIQSPWRAPGGSSRLDCGPRPVGLGDGDAATPASQGPAKPCPSGPGNERPRVPAVPISARNVACVSSAWKQARYRPPCLVSRGPALFAPLAAGTRPQAASAWARGVPESPAGGGL